MHNSVDTLPIAEPVGSANKLTALRLRLHRHLRGRYRWAILLGLILAVAGALHGYFRTKPQYRSNAMLRITPLTLRILYAQSDVPPSIFEGFVDVQVNIMRSPPVVDSILNSPSWQEVRGDMPPLGREAFLRNLDITHPIRSEIINISYTDATPEAAMVGVQSLIACYVKFYGDRSGNQRIAAIEERDKLLAKSMADLRAKLTVLTNEYGTDDLKEYHRAKSQEVTRMESLVKDTEINLILAEAALGNADDYKSMSVAEIAVNDEPMRHLVEEQQKLQTDLAIDGRGEEHPLVLVLKEKLSNVEARIQKRAEAFRGFHRASFLNKMGVVEGVPTPLAVDALRQRLKKLRELYDAGLAETLEIGRKTILIAGIQEELRVLKDRLTENHAKLEQLNVDSSVIGQINVISDGDRPPAPFKDRRKVMAVVGAGGGFFLGFMLVTALCLTDRRLRWSTDLDAGSVELRLLGVLPESRGESPESVALADFAMRRLTTALQADPQLQMARVLALASPAAADGKTEVASALAASFAQRGLRTLLMDFDLTGVGISRRLPLVGPSSTALPPLPSNPVGEPINCGSRGLSDFLAGAPLVDCVVDTGMAGLDVLPPGALAAGRVAGLSPASLDRALAAAAAAYDMVLIDTGPANQCLETILICKEAESVLLVARRNMHEPHLADLSRRLRGCGAHVGGVIFHAASSKEFAA